MRQAERPRLRHAVALGLLQGPTELLPISSSGHTTLIPWLAGSSYAELDPELRKSLEVALHAGAGVALAIDMRGELFDAARTLHPRRAVVIALSLAPPVLAGYTLERPIERRLGGPGSIAMGLIAGAVAMALADMTRPVGPGHPSLERSAINGSKRGAIDGSGNEGRALGPDKDRVLGIRLAQDAGPCDGWALGLAQAAALIPGVSRNGATLTAARARGFARADAQTLSWHAALPVILSASALRTWRMWRHGVPSDAWPVLVTGAASAFVSTSASARLLRRPQFSTQSLLPYAAYRCTIAAITIMRLRRTQNVSE
jgi:undecaprenyl-diphosphatase